MKSVEDIPARSILDGLPWSLETYGEYLGALYLFFFNDTATTEIYTLSLHDALPIYQPFASLRASLSSPNELPERERLVDRKSTRLNSSHQISSYAVFCLNKQNQ